MIKPFYTLLFLVIVGALTAVTAWFFPEEGIKVGEDFTIKFASFDSFLEEDTVVQIDVEDLLKSYEEPFDSLSFKDSVKTFEWNEKQKRLRIHFAENAEVKLPNFFDLLYNYKKGSGRIKIIHYGDSQIEGDRISSYIRNKFQKEYGGYGPGYAPGKMVVPSMSVTQNQSDEWKRYTIFGRKDTTVKHKNFGIYGIFSRFTPANIDTLNVDTTKAWIEFKPSYLGYGKTRSYKNLVMSYGNAESGFSLRILSDDEVIYDEFLQSSSAAALIELPIEKTPKVLRLEFKAVVSPDIYALHLESKTGVSVDNVAMRGSSGTVFRKMSSKQLAQQYAQVKPNLILLQYGGNTVPYIKSEKEAANYGNWFKMQIQYLKKLNPKADFILIGPSDMATKVNTDYVTYPYLEEVRDRLKEAALESGCGFWDIYEVMGGYNSMESWVNTSPALAGSDYIHFTPKGAKRIAELFYEALDKDYQEYVEYQKEMERQQELKLMELEKAKLDSLSKDSIVNES